jgi:hypothetical protein
VEALLRAGAISAASRELRALAWIGDSAAKAAAMTLGQVS